MPKLAIWMFLCGLLARGFGEEMTVFRLPDTVKPEYYNLRIVPEFKGYSDSTFTGLVEIFIKVIKTTKDITLNFKELEMTKVSLVDVTDEKPKDMKLLSAEPVAVNEQLVMRLDGGNVEQGRKYRITIEYKGKIRDDHNGFCMKSYEEAGSTKLMAMTVFQPTSARTVLPCFDEPSMKARFNVTLVKKKNQVVVSNMPIKKVESGDKTETVHFESTPPIPTYLLAFYMSDFESKSQFSASDSEQVSKECVTVYTQKKYINQTDYVGNNIQLHLKAMMDYIKVPIEMPKLDVVDNPDSSMFEYLYMENWGMYIIREDILLVTEDSDTMTKVYLSYVIQNLIARNWFGNLVTFAWWDQVWLTEGFAKYFEYFANGLVNTDWPMEEWFLVEVHQPTLYYDQETIRVIVYPIVNKANNPIEIEAVFTERTSSKAASVIRMLRYVVTEELFMLSLQNYLESKKYGVAVQNDLFKSFDDVLKENKYEIGNGLTVNSFMSNWTLQTDIPLVNISRDAKKNVFVVIQSRFVLYDSGDDKSKSQAWHIPLTYTTNVEKNFENCKPTNWTSKTSKTTEIPAPKNFQWYIFNIKAAGFYRVNYDLGNWLGLILQLQEDHCVIDVLNRAQLIDDAFAMANAGILDQLLALCVTNYMEKEDDVTPWYSASKAFTTLLNRVRRDKAVYDKLKAHVSKLSGSIYKKLEDQAYQGSAQFDILVAWQHFATFACSLGNPDCEKNVLEYFKKWQKKEKIPPDMLSVAFCEGVKQSKGDKTFNEMFKLFTTTTSISEKKSAGMALGCSTNRAHLVKYVNHLLDGPKGPIKPNDYLTIINAFLSTPLGVDVLIEFLLANIEKLIKDLPSGEYSVFEIFILLSEVITTDGEIAKVAKLVDDPKTPPSLKNPFNLLLEGIKAKVLWYNSYVDGVKQWAEVNGQCIAFL